MADELVGLTPFQRRRLGITPRRVLAIVEALRDRGVDVENIEKRDLATMVVDNLDDGGLAWNRVGAADWAAILAFVEKLLPVILQLIALFK